MATCWLKPRPSVTWPPGHWFPTNMASHSACFIRRALGHHYPTSSQSDLPKRQPLDTSPRLPMALGPKIHILYLVYKSLPGPAPCGPPTSASDKQTPSPSRPSSPIFVTVTQKSLPHGSLRQRSSSLWFCAIKETNCFLAVPYISQYLNIYLCDKFYY